MNDLIFLHNKDNFYDLIENLSATNNIEDILIEKDYWIMHALFSMQQLGFSFHLKGGTSLSKGYHCIHRFSEDIDIKIDPDEDKCGFKVYFGKNHDKSKHCDSRKNFFDWICAELEGKINGITDVTRYEQFDDPSGKYRNGGILLQYKSALMTASGIKNGILLEVGFGKTAPSIKKNISSWAYDDGSKRFNIIDNRAVNVPCYEPRYTFVEKLQAIVRKYRLYKEKEKSSTLPDNFIRHYYDLYQLINREDVQNFIGSDEYNEFKSQHFGKYDDTNINNCGAFKLQDPNDKKVFDNAYNRSEDLYYMDRPSFQQILDRISQDIERL